jgi:hypothetical protein
MATPNLGFQNFFTTTLSSGITATDTTIYLNSLPTPTEGYLVIEPDSSTNKEIIYYTSKGANFVTLPSIVAGRGVGATTAVSHNTGVTCQMNVVAEHFEALQDGTAFAVGGIGATAYADGWTPILGSTPNTVTYNGNRNYDLVFNSVDLTSTLSPGMRLKATRTVAAPTQCTDLEASSSQYYNKTSPAGMTFTDDFTVSAWIKLESYGLTTVASRWNGTSGWSLRVGALGVADGRVQLFATNANSGNYSAVVSYASIPLNKWVHIAAQLDMSTFTATTTTSYIMIDGVDVPAFVQRAGTNPTALIQAGNLEIGSENGGTGPFDGKIAQVAIYSAKIPQATIKASCNQTLSGSETSLISAYSFNGVITDLNTTNANNLTANGSAVATNADSPFAQSALGVPTGTTEYGVITNTAFSTNTTLTVQVAEGGAIPTSGGVSALSYSTHRTPFGFVADTGRWTVLMLSLGSTTSVSIGSINNWFSSSLGLKVPVGRWRVGYQGTVYQSSSVAGVRSAYFTIDTTTPVSFVKTGNFVVRAYSAASATVALINIYKVNYVELSVAATFTLFGGVDNVTGTETYTIAPDSGPLTIFAECAYI